MKEIKLNADTLLKVSVILDAIAGKVSFEATRQDVARMAAASYLFAIAEDAADLLARAEQLKTAIERNYEDDVCFCDVFDAVETYSYTTASRAKAPFLYLKGGVLQTRNCD